MPTRLLIIDAHNVDMKLSEILGHRPTASERPNTQALLNWALQRAEPDHLVAAQFINTDVIKLANPKFTSWLWALAEQGFLVFTHPKDEAGEGDVDFDMLDFIKLMLEPPGDPAEIAVSAAMRRFVTRLVNPDWRGRVSEVMVASHDAQRFVEPLNELVERGIKVCLLGFVERLMGWGQLQDAKTFDLGLVEGVFNPPLVRTFDPRNSRAWLLRNWWPQPDGSFLQQRPLPPSAPGSGWPVVTTSS